MQKQLRSRSRAARPLAIDEPDQTASPSFFEWRERTMRIQAYKPPPKLNPPRLNPPKLNPIVRLLRRFV
jgi:hypothetical protein